MTILELEQRTQLDRATIRYYEKEGLIHPARKENSYRDYSENDLEEILRIKLLRQLDVPIERIKQLQQGNVGIGQVLLEHAAALEKQVTETQKAAALCKEISTHEVTYKNLDATPYLDKLKENGEAEAPKEEPANPDSYREYHPVRRFIARAADYYLLEAIVRFLLVVVFRIRPYSDFLSYVVNYGCLVASIPLQALSLHLFGTTPCKWLMGIRVLGYDGRKLDMHNAMRREGQALLYGYGLGIPFVRLYRLYQSYKAYRDRAHLVQDVGVDHVYEYWGIFWNVGKKTVFAAFCAIIILINCASVFDIMKPKHRGNDLTVAQFAENFNYYSEILEYGARMNPDGTWLNTTNQMSGNAVVVIGSNPQKTKEPFRFETEGERVTRITYQNTWTDVLMLQPISKPMISAIYTSVGSQKGLSVIDIIDVLKLLAEYEDDETAKIQYENIEISWKIKTDNCSNSKGTYYPIDSKKPSRLTLDFEIIIH